MNCIHGIPFFNTCVSCGRNLGVGCGGGSSFTTPPRYQVVKFTKEKTVEYVYVLDTFWGMVEKKMVTVPPVHQLGDKKKVC